MVWLEGVVRRTIAAVPVVTPRHMAVSMVGTIGDCGSRDRAECCQRIPPAIEDDKIDETPLSGHGGVRLVGHGGVPPVS